MHIMYCGPVGAGKTFNAVAEAVKDAGDNIATNTELNAEAIERYYDANPKLKLAVAARADGSSQHKKKNIILWTDFGNDTVKDAKCGCLLIDEAPLWLDARKYDALSPDARRKIIEHRKDDLLLLSTAQDVAFIDKVFRLLCDEIRLVRGSWLPFVGWFVPTCVRPTIVCKDCARVRRDGAGDDRGIRKLFGCGTIYTWTTFKAKDLIDAQDTTGETVAPKSIGSGWRLFDTRIAACYETSMKLSHIAEHAMATRPKKQGMWQKSKIGEDIAKWGDPQMKKDAAGVYPEKIQHGDIMNLPL